MNYCYQIMYIMDLSNINFLLLIHFVGAAERLKIQKFYHYHLSIFTYEKEYI